MGSGVGYIPNTKFEWYLKNHLGSTMLVYGTQADANPAHSDIGTPLAAYDYRAFGEMVELLPPPTGKVTENFTGKEHDDEIALNYFGARYLDPMLGMWISVDPARQFASPYLYAGNGYNPIGGVDPNGMFYEDGERCTEGMFVDATTNQGHVDPVVFDDLVLAHNEIMSVYDDILTAAAYTAGGYGGETRFWIDNGTTNGWGATPPKQAYVNTEEGRGFFFHVHLMRDNPNSPKQGLSPDDLERAAEKRIATSALEVTTGRLFYFNAKPKYAPLVPRSLYPSGNIYDFRGYQIMTINPQSYKIPAPIILPKDTHYYK
jgi:RHS repeat-associated protein